MKNVTVNLRKVLASDKKEFVGEMLDGTLIWLQHRWCNWTGENVFTVDNQHLEMAYDYGLRHRGLDFPPLKLIDNPTHVLYLGHVVNGPHSGAYYVFCAPRASRIEDLRKQMLEEFNSDGREPKIALGDFTVSQLSWTNTSEKVRNALSGAKSEPTRTEGMGGENAAQAAKLAALSRIQAALN